MRRPCLSPGNIVLDVHVKLLHMHMSCCSTCTCRTALHVHLKQCYTPRLHTLLYEIELYRYRRKRLIAMTNAIKLKTVQSKTHHRVAQSSTEYYLSDKTRINTDRHRLKDCGSLSYICFPLRKSAIICVSIKI